MPDTTPNQPDSLVIILKSPSWNTDLVSRLILCPGFPLRASISVWLINSQKLIGSPPERDALRHKFLDASLRTYHGLRWTPPTLHIQTITDALVLPSVTVKTLGDRNKLISKLYQHLRECGLPYGLYDSLCTLRPYCSLLNLRTPPQTQHSIRVDG